MLLIQVRCKASKAADIKQIQIFCLLFIMQDKKMQHAIRQATGDQ